jgi:hypothetical protein
MAGKRKISNEAGLNLLETLIKYSKICLVERLKMGVIEIESELQKMSNTERFFVIEIATKLIRGETNGKCRLSLEEKHVKLRQSAEIMLSEYTNNKNLVMN